jgi:hypothetical protein
MNHLHTYNYFNIAKVKNYVFCPWNGDISGNAIVAEVVKKFPAFLMRKGRLKFSQRLQIINIFSQMKPVQILKTPFLKSQFHIMHTYEHAVSPNNLFLLDYPTKIVFVFLIFSIITICPRQTRQPKILRLFIPLSFSKK